MTIKFKFGKWPKRRARKADKFGLAVDRLVRGLKAQIVFLDSDEVVMRGRSQWFIEQDGIWSCCIYVSNKKMPLDDTGELVFEAGSANEAKAKCKQLLDAVKARH